MHHTQGQSYGVARHKTSQDMRSAPTDAFAASAAVKAGESKVFLSVLVPHDVTEKAETALARIRTGVDDTGIATATIGRLRVTVRANGAWAVQR